MVEGSLDHEFDPRSEECKRATFFLCIELHGEARYNPALIGRARKKVTLPTRLPRAATREFSAGSGLIVHVLR